MRTLIVGAEEPAMLAGGCARESDKAKTMVENDTKSTQCVHVSIGHTEVPVRFAILDSPSAGH